MYSKISKEIIKCNELFHKENSTVDALIYRIKNIDLRYLREDEFSSKTEGLKKSVCKGISDVEILVEAFALVYEAVYRALSIKPFDCQLVAGIHLCNNKIIEMQTGEGKTLSAVFAAYFAALVGKGIHVLTFNDYLAKRIFFN